MVPPEAFSMSAAQASAAGCIGCEAGTQWAKRHSTVLSWASAGPAHSSAAASARLLSCVIQSSPRRSIVIDYYSPPPRRQGRCGSGIIGCVRRALLPIRIGKRVVLLGSDVVARLAEQRRGKPDERRLH